MKVVHTVNDLKQTLQAYRNEGKTIGLVPTMGALHRGHASLVSRSLRENDVTTVSIFVNPTQFNDKNDLAKYPRTLDQDCQLLQSLLTDDSQLVVFAPSVDEVYPEPDTRTFSYPPTDEVMEGGFRPGHFNGVCQVVSKLFMFVEPDRAYFGEKDFQQIAVIRRMVEDQKFPLQLCPCPIVREDDGLALSSRNTLLSDAERKIALNISKNLFASLDYAKQHTLAETRQWVIDQINAVEGLEVQYYEIVDGNSLLSLNDWNDSNYIVGCITVFCGAIPVRLIDNIKYKE
ncbi:MAG: pantoate--beta-alanine ligase [Prevotellaceae bacterium]|nr:pantoate--beta-alanine ligase [Candidatus Colivivens caballi]